MCKYPLCGYSREDLKNFLKNKGKTSGRDRGEAPQEAALNLGLLDDSDESIDLVASNFDLDDDEKNAIKDFIKNDNPDRDDVASAVKKIKDGLKDKCSSSGTVCAEEEEAKLRLKARLDNVKKGVCTVPDIDDDDAESEDTCDGEADDVDDILDKAKQELKHLMGEEDDRPELIKPSDLPDISCYHKEKCTKVNDLFSQLTSNACTPRACKNAEDPESMLRALAQKSAGPKTGVRPGADPNLICNLVSTIHTKQGAMKLDEDFFDEIIDDDKNGLESEDRERLGKLKDVVSEIRKIYEDDDEEDLEEFEITGDALDALKEIVAKCKENQCAFKDTYSEECDSATDLTTR